MKYDRFKCAREDESDRLSASATELLNKYVRKCTVDERGVPWDYIRQVDPVKYALMVDGGVTCRVLKIARQPYYRWLAEPATDAELTAAYRANSLFDSHRDDPEFGYRFLVDEARETGEPMAERTAWKICSELGWWSAFGKKRGRNGKKPGPPVHDDLVERDFTADAPNRLWLSDITEHWTREGKLYVCAIKDVYSNRIVGYSIGAELGVPARRVSRVLARHGMPRLCALDPITGQQLRASKATAVRYERELPGELVHMDVKKIGRIPDGGGWRIHGRASRSITRDRNTKVGFDYVHSLVDDHSRLAYSEIQPDEKGTTCAAFLARAIDYFAAHGIDRIHRLMTENAWAYRWSLREVCTIHGIKQNSSDSCPWQNGKAERFNRTPQTEWAYRRPFTSNTERAAALAPWINSYNTDRRHSALGGLPPISRL